MVLINCSASVENSPKSADANSANGKTCRLNAFATNDGKSDADKVRIDRIKS